MDVHKEHERLDSLAHELRAATAAALAAGSWFAPTLDDCRVDAERLLAIDTASRDAHDVHLLCTRAALAIRTWYRIAALTGARLHCRACGRGLLIAIARPGRLVPFRGMQVELPADLAIPTCDQCGWEGLDDLSCARLDELLFAEYLRRNGNG